MNYSTSDISLAAYLNLKGYPVIDTQTEGRFTTFIFLEEAEEVAKDWQLSPTEEMRTLQNYTTEKERLFKAIKESRDKQYGNYR